MKTKEFPNECCRCGMCCLCMTCEAGQAVFGINRDELCHALVFKGDETTCRLAPYLVPVGDGCCIKARAYKDGMKFDFASLPVELKKKAAQSARMSGMISAVRVGLVKGGER